MADLQSLEINDTGYLGLPRGTSVQRPGTPSAGYLRFNTVTNTTEYYDGSSWIYGGDRNAIDPTFWTTGSGSATGFSRNGATAENERISTSGPFGTTTVWECRPDSVSGPDGGWNTGLFDIDNTYKYRFSVWVRRTTIGNGHFYLGTNGFNSSNTNVGVLNRSNGSTNTNPYFEVNVNWGNWSENNANIWYLVVGHVWPEGSGTGTADSESGVYKTDGSQLAGSDKRDYVWSSTSTRTRHRCYLFYSTNTATRQQMVYPRVDKLDGNAPSINELISGKYAF